MEQKISTKKLVKKKISRYYSINPENIIFYDYFNNLKRKALAQGYNNLVISYKKIINSILKYPLPIKNCYDAFKLKGVGKHFSYEFEKALVQLPKESNYKCNDDNYFSNVDVSHIRNHINKVIKNADNFLIDFNELHNIKKKGAISEDDHILNNLKEIGNDYINIENTNSKCKVKIIEKDNKPINIGRNDNILCQTIESKKYNYNDFLNNDDIISDNINNKNKVFIECEEELEKKKLSPNKIEKIISNYKKCSVKKNKKIELNNLEKNILTLINNHSHLYNENAMSKEEINIEYLKNYKKSENINFRSLNRLIKLNLLERIECVENKSCNSSNKSKKMLKLKILNKIKLTEKGKEFFDEEKEKLLKTALNVIEEYEKSSVKIDDEDERNLSTKKKDIEENLKIKEKLSTKINELEEKVCDHYSDDESDFMIFNNIEEGNSLNYLGKLSIKEKKERKIKGSTSNSQHSINLYAFENIDNNKKKSFESIKEFNLIEEKKESDCFEIKIENKKKELNKIKLSLRERIEKKYLERNMSNNTSGLLTYDTPKENYFIDDNKNEIIEKQNRTKPENLLWKEEKTENKDELIKSNEENNTKIINNINKKKNNMISHVNCINSENKNKEKMIIREKIRNLDNGGEIITYSNNTERKLIYNSKYEKNYGNHNINIRENIEKYDNKEDNVNIIDLSEEFSDKKNNCCVNDYIKSNKKDSKENIIMCNRKNEIKKEYENEDTEIEIKDKKKKKKRKKNENEIDIEIDIEMENEEIENDNNKITYGPYEIFMVIDNRDISGANSEYNEKMKEIFKLNNVKYITRNLPLGDNIWLCRRAVYNCNNNSSKKKNTRKKKKHKKKNEETNVYILNKNNDITNHNEEENIKYEEYVLNYIIERKTLSDLSASIIDGRYDEQKYRLMRSKEKYHIIYLIENSNNSYKNYINCSKFSYETLTNAQHSTQLISGFSILNSQGMDHTLFLLSEIHFQIIKNVKEFCCINKNQEINDSDKLSLYLKSNFYLWEQWNNESKKSKNNIVKEVFGKQLRLINMCGADATELILSLWPTPFNLNQALNKYTHDGILAEKIKKFYLKNYIAKGKKKVKSPIDTQLIAQLRQLYAPDSISSFNDTLNFI